MKIWLNEQYAIEQTDGNNLFGKGNDNFDFIEVYIPTAVYEQDNVIPVFIFERADKKKYGEFAHNVGTWQQDGYTVFKHVLNGFVLAHKGNLDITIKLNFLKYVDEKRFIEKTKNLYVQGVVLNAIVVENEAFILSDEPEAFLTSLKYLLNDLNARIESGDFTASNAIADRNNNIIDTTYETKADAQTKLVNAYGHASTLVNSLESTVSNTYETKNSATAKLNEAKHHTDIAVAEVSNKVSTLQSNIENGTVVANNANEAVSYRNDENNLVVIKDKIEDILYLINDVTGADLTGLQSKINALQTAWNKFMNGSESDDVIDTLNEIRNELASLDSASKKALYNLGAFDTISGNVITRKTGKFEINENTCSFAYYETYCVVVPLVDLNASENLLVKCNRLTSVYDSDILNNIYRLGASDNRFAIIGSSMTMTSDSWKEYLFDEPLFIEYELANSYTEQVIEGVPLITLDSQGSKWLTDEYEKGLNLFDGVFGINYGVPLANLEVGKTYTFSTTTTGHAYKISVSAFAIDLVETYNAKITFVMTEEYKNCSIYTIQSGTTPIKSENIMLNEGSVAYDYQLYNANKHITNFEADFLKEESLKSGNLCNFTTANYNDDSRTITASGSELILTGSDSGTHLWIPFDEPLPKGLYTFNVVFEGESATTAFELYTYETKQNYGTRTPITRGAFGSFVIQIDSEYDINGLFFLYSGSINGTLKFMITKGSEAQPYHEFEGEIVRSKELKEQVEGIKYDIKNNYVQKELIDNSGTHVIDNKGRIYIYDDSEDGYVDMVMSDGKITVSDGTTDYDLLALLKKISEL